MKAIVVEQFGGPEVMKLKNIPVPKVGKDQVLVRLRAAGVNPVDAYIRSGQYALKPKLPYTPGLDGAGVIVKSGASLRGYCEGLTAYCSGSLTGTYAEYALCRADQVHPLPRHVSFEKGAAVNVAYATAYRAVHHKARARSGEMMLVHGASGGVGTAAVQLGHAAGLCVIATAGTARGRKLLEKIGAHYVADHRKPGYLEDILKITGGTGVHIILEMLANVNLVKDFGVLAKFGRIVVIGSRGALNFDPRLTMGKDASIHGMSLMNVPEDDLYSIHTGLVAGLENGVVDPVIGRKFALKDAAKAHEAVMQPGAYGKIILKV